MVSIYLWIDRGHLPRTGEAAQLLEKMVGYSGGSGGDIRTLAVVVAEGTSFPPTYENADGIYGIVDEVVDITAIRDESSDGPYSSSGPYTFFQLDHRSGSWHGVVPDR